MMPLALTRSDFIFDNFTLYSEHSEQDCINGMLLLLGQAESVELNNFKCKSDLIYKFPQPLKSTVKNVCFYDSQIENPDLLLE